MACHWYIYYNLQHLKSITENSRWHNTKWFCLTPFWGNIQQYNMPRYHFSLKLSKCIYFGLNWVLSAVMCYTESRCQCFMSGVLKQVLDKLPEINEVASMHWILKLLKELCQLTSERNHCFCIISVKKISFFSTACL